MHKRPKMSPQKNEKDVGKQQNEEKKSWERTRTV
jgi:hypothetical protein